MQPIAQARGVWDALVHAAFEVVSCLLAADRGTVVVFKQALPID